jgi:coatomer protein complex subunit alpha (xenin)
LAFLTAATHGLDEEAELLQQQLEAAGQPVPTVNPSAVFLQPPPPIAQAESNWPLLTVSKVRRCLDFNWLET